MATHTPISEQEVLDAQAAWGASVVAVGDAPTWQESHALATELVEQLYVTDGSLLFRPTLAQEAPFRHTAQAAISYFVGRSTLHTEDGGFALAPWRAVRFDNAGVVTHGATAQAMGDYYFTRPDGTELRVQYSFVYIRDANGKLRIQLHHSALPYSD